MAETEKAIHWVRSIEIARTGQGESGSPMLHPSLLGWCWGPRNLSHLLALPRGPQYSCLVQANARAWYCIRITYVDSRCPKIWAIICHLPRCEAGSWSRGRVSGAENGIEILMSQETAQLAVPPMPVLAASVLEKKSELFWNRVTVRSFFYSLNICVSVICFFLICSEALEFRENIADWGLGPMDFVS